MLDNARGTRGIERSSLELRGAGGRALTLRGWQRDLGAAAQRFTDADRLVGYRLGAGSEQNQTADRKAMHCEQIVGRIGAARQVSGGRAVTRARGRRLLGVDRPHAPRNAGLGIAQHHRELAGIGIIDLDLEVCIRQIEVVHRSA